MNKILIAGASGFIGQNLVKGLMNKYFIIGLDTDPYASNLCNLFYNEDISNFTSINQIIRKHSPEIIIHTAAMKSLNECETKRNEATIINFIATKNLNQICIEIGARFIFISSDQVFSGNSSCYRECDEKSPINFYGMTKNMAEEEVLKNPTAAICRTALVFGGIPENQKEIFDNLKKNDHLIVQGFIVDHVFFKLRNNERIKLPLDEYCSPTSADLLTKQIRTVIEKKLCGIFHCSGGERISRYQFGIKIANKFNLNSNLIDPSLSHDKLRPKDVSLNVSFTQDKFEFKFPNIDNMIQYWSAK